MSALLEACPVPGCGNWSPAGEWCAECEREPYITPAGVEPDWVTELRAWADDPVCGHGWWWWDYAGHRCRWPLGCTCTDLRSEQTNRTGSV